VCKIVNDYLFIADVEKHVRHKQSPSVVMPRMLFYISNEKVVNYDYAHL